MNLQYVAMQAAQGNPFFVSKLINLPIEHNLAPDIIWRFYQGQRLRLLDVRWNEAADNTAAQAGWDLAATVEVIWTNTRIDFWELKTDKLWWKTGNVFVEHEAARHSKATYLLLFADRPYVLALGTVLELISGPYRVVRGGDGNRATGSLVPLANLSIYDISRSGV